MSRATAASAGRPRISWRSSITTTIGRPSTASKPWMASSIVSHPATSRSSARAQPWSRWATNRSTEPSSGSVRSQIVVASVTEANWARAVVLPEPAGATTSVARTSRMRASRLSMRSRWSARDVWNLRFGADHALARCHSHLLGPLLRTPPRGANVPTAATAPRRKSLPAGVGAAPLQRWLSARLRWWADGWTYASSPGDPDMMLNLIDAVGGFENPVAQLVIMGIAGVATVGGVGLPARAVRRGRRLKPVLPA